LLTKEKNLLLVLELELELVLVLELVLEKFHPHRRLHRHMKKELK
jgi:hypothetical protein